LSILGGEWEKNHHTKLLASPVSKILHSTLPRGNENFSCSSARIWSFLKGKVNVTTRLTLHAGSGSFDYCNSETIPSDSKLALISFNVSLFARMGKQSVIQYPRETVSRQPIYRNHSNQCKWKSTKNQRVVYQEM